MTGSSVNTQAQAAEQQNQNTAQQYAAQQQAAAIQALNQYIQKNPSPASTAKPIAAPQTVAPKTMGGGTAVAGGGGQVAPAQATAVPGSAPMQGAPQTPTPGGLSPQLQALVAQLSGQSAPKPSA